MSVIRLLSPTMVDTIRTCPLKAHYRYVERLPERAKSGALILGIAVDGAAKFIVHGLRSGEMKAGAIDSAAILDKAWGEELSRARDVVVVWGEKGSEAKSKATAVGLLDAFVALPDLEKRVARIQEGEAYASLRLPWGVGREVTYGRRGASTPAASRRLRRRGRVGRAASSTPRDGG